MPSQPPDPYSRQFNFTNHAQTQPTTPLPGDKVDLELNEVRESLNATISRLNEIQRDDGKVRDSALDGYTIDQSVAAAESARDEAEAARVEAVASKNLCVAAQVNVQTIANAALMQANAANANAMLYAQQAQSSADTAQTAAASTAGSANAAAASASSAQTSASTASSSASAAQGYATDAQNAANAASASASAAATSASQALTSKNAAQSSATAAASSATSAQTFAGDATISAQNAAESAVDAEASAQAAEAAANSITANSVRFDVAQSLTAGEKTQARSNMGLGSAATQDSSAFAPVNHDHDIAEIVGLQSTLDGKAAASHTHSIANVTGLQAALDGKQASGDYATNSALTSGLAGKANTSHAHAIADVTGLQAALDGKAAASHTHTASQITDFNSAVDARVPGAVPSASTTVQGKVELATNAEAVAGTDTALAVTPANLRAYRDRTNSQTYLATSSQGNTNGTGSVSSTSFGSMLVSAPNTAVGYATRFNGWQLAQIGGSANAGWAWNQRIEFVCRFNRQLGTTDSNSLFRILVGRATNGYVAAGDLAARGIGVRCVNGAAMQLQVHNGTTLTNVTSSFTPSTQVTYELRLLSDGTGNVTLWIDGVQVATTSDGPFDSSVSTGNGIALEAENIGTVTGTKAQLQMSNFQVTVG